MFHPPCPQAAAVWGWSNWLDAEATRAGKELLLFNLDETPIPLTFTHSQGNVMRLDPARAWLRAPRQQSNRAVQRSYFTHVGLICNDPAVQPSRAVSCRVMPCRAVPCRAVPCRAVPCRAEPSRAEPCRALPCRAVPYRAVPCLAAPCRSVPCRAVRSPAEVSGCGLPL